MPDEPNWESYRKKKYDDRADYYPYKQKKKKILGIRVDAKENEVRKEAIEGMTDYYEKKLQEKRNLTRDYYKGNLLPEEERAVATAIANYKLRKNLDLRLRGKSLAILAKKLVNEPYFQEMIKENKIKQGLELELMVERSLIDVAITNAGFNNNKFVRQNIQKMIEKNPQIAFETRRNIRYEFNYEKDPYKMKSEARKAKEAIKKLDSAEEASKQIMLEKRLRENWIKSVVKKIKEIKARKKPKTQWGILKAAGKDTKLKRRKKH